MNTISIYSRWKARPETPVQIADRLESLVAKLRPITPAFRRWYQVISEDNIPEIEPRCTWLVNAVAASVCTGDLGEPAPALGYLPITVNALPGVDRSDDVYLKMVCASTNVDEVALHPTRFQELDPAIFTYSVFKQAVLAISEAFAPDFCQAGHFSLWKDMKTSDYVGRPIIMPCWMVYLSPPLARRITPPPDVVSERFADGSLFMAVTDQRFDPDDARHVAAAHRMFAVIDALQEKKRPDRRRR